MTLHTQRVDGDTRTADSDVVITDLVRQWTRVEKRVRKKPQEVTSYTKLVGPALLKHLSEVANTTSVVLSPILGADYCTVTIKLLWRMSGSTVVHTLLRDVKSHRERSAYQPKNDFDVSENSAFADLVSNRNTEALFISNNLRLDAARGRYKNSNEYWRDLYNCTAVVRINRPSNPGDILGFLCVDRWSWNSGAPSEPVRDVLLKISNHIYNTLELIAPENEEKQKPLGFRFEGSQLVPVDEDFQVDFQSTLEPFRADFDLNFLRREVRDGSYLAGTEHFAFPAPSEGTEMFDNQTLRAMLGSAAQLPRVQRLRSTLSKMTPEDIANRLRPIAKRNEYAKQLLQAAKKKRVIR